MDQVQVYLLRKVLVLLDNNVYMYIIIYLMRHRLKLCDSILLFRYVLVQAFILQCNMYVMMFIYDRALYRVLFEDLVVSHWQLL